MRGSVASSVRDEVSASTDQYWSIEDFNLDSHAVASELSRLRRAPAVEAVRKLVSEDEALGAAGWYATNLLRLSTQVSPVPVVAVTTRVPTGLKDVRVIDRSNRTGRRAAKLNETEVTYLEALEAWEDNVELGNKEAFNRFVELLNLKALREEKLVEASGTESSRVRERLRAVLSESGEHALAEKVKGAKSPSSVRRARQVLPVSAA